MPKLKIAFNAQGVKKQSLSYDARFTAKSEEKLNFPSSTNKYYKSVIKFTVNSILT